MHALLEKAGLFRREWSSSTLARVGAGLRQGAGVALLLGAQLSWAEPAPTEPADECQRPELELEPIERVAPRFPIDGPRGGYITDGDCVVFELNVDRNGQPSRIHLLCTTGSALLVRVAEGALRRWQFAPAETPYRGKISLTFRYSNEQADPITGPQG